MRCSSSNQRYYYPDVLVTNEVFADNRFAQKPVLLAEVLSPATRSFDMVDKFMDYSTIPTLGYYLLVEPENCHVPSPTKPSRVNGWPRYLIKRMP